MNKKCLNKFFTRYFYLYLVYAFGTIPGCITVAESDELHTSSTGLSQTQIQTYLNYAVARLRQDDTKAAIDTYRFILGLSVVSTETREHIRKKLEDLSPTEANSNGHNTYPPENPEILAAPDARPVVHFSEQHISQSIPPGVVKQHLDSSESRKNNTSKIEDENPSKNNDTNILPQLTTADEEQKISIKTEKTPHPLPEDKGLDTAKAIPALNFSMYAENFDNQTPGYINTGYSGYSSTLTAAYASKVSAELSGNIALEFSWSTDAYSLTTKEAWLEYKTTDDKNNLSLGIGTQALFDTRGWFYDTTLDMFSARLVRDNWTWSLSAGRESLYYPLESDATYPLRWITGITHHWSTTNYLTFIHTGAYDNSYRDDSVRSTFRWLGAQASGIAWENSNNRLDYWAQIGFMTGQESFLNNGSVEQPSTRHRGWGFDLGTTLTTNLPWRPELTLSFATSSGDTDPTDNTSTHYRQSGIQSNSADIGSAYGLSYYGNALAPELANLQITALGITFPLPTSSYLSIFLRDYRLIDSTTTGDNVFNGLSLTGESRKVGQALDLDFSFWESHSWYSSLTLGAFFADRAVEKPHPKIFYGLLEVGRDL